MKFPVIRSGNFRNPCGLLLRMLFSGNRAAYSALAGQFLKLVTGPFDWCLQLPEQRLPCNPPASELPVLLVVGAPRSGTTLVYQTLARYLDVSVFTNLNSMFPRSPLMGAGLARCLPRRNRPDFENYYGQTAGLQGPNDAFALWNRWLGEDRYVPRTNLSSSEQQDIRRFFHAWQQIHGKPFLNKNNRNTACLSLLSQVLPQARFIVVRRNPILVAQSLMTAREQVQGDKSIGWGLHSQSSESTSDPLSCVDDVADQILLIERELDAQLSRIPRDRIVEFTYEGFCETPEAVVRFISQACPGVGILEDRMSAELKPFHASERITLSDAEQTRLLSRLEARPGRAATGNPDLVVNRC